MLGTELGLVTESSKSISSMTLWGGGVTIMPFLQEVIQKLREVSDLPKVTLLETLQLRSESWFAKALFSTQHCTLE